MIVSINIHTHFILSRKNKTHTPTKNKPRSQRRTVDPVTSQRDGVGNFEGYQNRKFLFLSKFKTFSNLYSKTFFIQHFKTKFNQNYPKPIPKPTKSKGCQNLHLQANQRRGAGVSAGNVKVYDLLNFFDAY